MKTLTIHNPANILGGAFSATFRGNKIEEVGQTVKLVDTTGQELANAEILDSWFGPLGHVPALFMEMAQDPLQRTFSGLHTHLMIHRYKDHDKTPLDLEVSVLVLKV